MGCVSVLHFSDSFWFSAVEEGMQVLAFHSIVLGTLKGKMLPMKTFRHGLFGAYPMGLSIVVHLLNCSPFLPSRLFIISGNILSTVKVTHPHFIVILGILLDHHLFSHIAMSDCFCQLFWNVIRMIFIHCCYRLSYGDLFIRRKRFKQLFFCFIHRYRIFFFHHYSNPSVRTHRSMKITGTLNFLLY
jgi:hypothetical protein